MLGGRRYLGCYLLAATIFTLGLVRDHLCVVEHRIADVQVPSRAAGAAVKHTFAAPICSRASDCAVSPGFALCAVFYVHAWHHGHVPR